MLDEQDQGTRIGVGVALGVVLLLIVGLLGWLTMRGGPKAPATAMAAAAAPAGTAATAAAVATAATTTTAATSAATAAPPSLADAFVDAPLSGAIAGTVYFAIGKAELPTDAGVALAAIKQVAQADTNKKLLLSDLPPSAVPPIKPKSGLQD
jgi:hypothetical protein